MKTHKKIKAANPSGGSAHSTGGLNLKAIKLPSPPPKANSRRVQAVRHQLEMSQAVFAAMFNVSVKLVQGWEQGLRTCGRGELRLLEIMEKHPKIFRDFVKISESRR